ncbi:MAG TPA: hypothetical protein VNJ70_20880 [Thermoanaerobaculia bacterium]|nr:hypothetical protein [Thermoanaerobaculia bacterium]
MLYGWRTSTIDVDVKPEPEADSFFRALPALKERLEINVELAAPDLSSLSCPGWRERSPFVRAVEQGVKTAKRLKEH